MLLVKCDCGCFFTLKDNGKKPLVKCPDCEAILNLESSAGANYEVSRVPNSAKISVKFDA